MTTQLTSDVKHEHRVLGGKLMDRLHRRKKKSSPKPLLEQLDSPYCQAGGINFRDRPYCQAGGHKFKYRIPLHTSPPWVLPEQEPTQTATLLNVVFCYRSLGLENCIKLKLRKMRLVPQQRKDSGKGDVLHSLLGFFPGFGLGPVLRSALKCAISPPLACPSLQHQARSVRISHHIRNFQPTGPSSQWSGSPAVHSHSYKQTPIS